MLFKNLLSPLYPWDTEPLPPGALNSTVEMDRTLASPEFAPLLDSIQDTDARDKVEHVIRAMNYTAERELFLQAIRIHQPVIYPAWGRTEVRAQYAHN